MDYYISVSNSCNLSCTFCFLHQQKKERTKETSVNDVINFINKQSHLNSESNNIVFYGGEPLLSQKKILEFINYLPSNIFKFSMYTNGMLLNQIEDEILCNLSYLILSIDGDEEKNDIFRGKGTLKKVLNNLSQIGPNFKGETVARLTVTQETNIYSSLIPIINHFDHFFWQHESSESLNGVESFQKKHSDDLERLTLFWIDNIKNGKVINLIPFQSIVSSLFFGEKVESFRCGCGKSYIFIDYDGKCYTCDELVDYDQFYIGNVFNGVNFSGEDPYKKTIPYCRSCESFNICGGRCIAAYIKYSEEKFLFYCNLTKQLINTIEKYKNNIINEITRNSYSKEDFHTYLTCNIFEEIP